MMWRNHIVAALHMDPEERQGRDKFRAGWEAYKPRLADLWTITHADMRKATSYICLGV
jgi:hypothetical protein